MPSAQEMLAPYPLYTGADMVNFVFVELFIFVLFVLFKADKLAYFILSIRALLIFFINGVLFQPWYMPDQGGYLICSSRFREFNFFCPASGTVYISSIAFALIPLPFIVSVHSIAFMNALLGALTYLYFHIKKIFTEFSKNFFLFYPSFILYNGCGVRDIFIMCFMIIAWFYLIEDKNIFLFFLCIIALFLIKPHNAAILLICFIISFYKGNKWYHYLGIIVAALGAFAVFGQPILDELNFYRRAMFAEDGGKGKIPEITMDLNGLTEAFLSFVYFPLKPLPWEAGNAFQLIQSIENSILFFIMSMIFFSKPLESEKNRFRLLKIFIIVSFAIYGLVVFNYGTAARYRFPFIVLFVVFGAKYTNLQSLMNRVPIRIRL